MTPVSCVTGASADATKSKTILFWAGWARVIQQELRLI
jgi:hypothetical protein